jgi:hypothetical protein
MFRVVVRVGYEISGIAMKQRAKSTDVAMHPASGHRTPDQLTKDSVGPMGQPDLDVKAGQDRTPPGADVVKGDTDVSPLGKPSEPE